MQRYNPDALGSQKGRVGVPNENLGAIHKARMGDRE